MSTLARCGFPQTLTSTHPRTHRATMSATQEVRHDDHRDPAHRRRALLEPGGLHAPARARPARDPPPAAREPVAEPRATAGRADERIGVRLLPRNGSHPGRRPRRRPRGRRRSRDLRRRPHQQLRHLPLSGALDGVRHQRLRRGRGRPVRVGCQADADECGPRRSVARARRLHPAHDRALGGGDVPQLAAERSAIVPVRTLLPGDQFGRPPDPQPGQRKNDQAHPQGVGEAHQRARREPHPGRGRRGTPIRREPARPDPARTRDPRSGGRGVPGLPGDGPDEHLPHALAVSRARRRPPRRRGRQRR